MTSSRSLQLLRVATLHATSRPTRRGVGWWAWLLQRITGIALVAYLMIHILVISTAFGGAKSFDATLGVFEGPVGLIADIGLSWIVLYHALNGIRVVLFDAGFGTKWQSELFWGVFAVSVGLTGVSAYLAWPVLFR